MEMNVLKWVWFMRSSFDTIIIFITLIVVIVVIFFIIIISGITTETLLLASENDISETCEWFDLQTKSGLCWRHKSLWSEHVDDDDDDYCYL